MFRKKNRNFEFIIIDRTIEFCCFLCVLKMYGIINAPYIYLIMPALVFPAIIIILILIAMASMIIKTILNKIIYDRRNA